MRFELKRRTELAFAIEGPETGPMALADVAPWAAEFAVEWWAQREPTAFGDTGIVEVSGHETVSSAWKRALMLNHYGLDATMSEAVREGDVPGHEFHGNQYAGGSGGSYRDSKGTDPSVNAALVASSGVKLSVPLEQKRDAEEALAHVLEDRHLLEEMKGMEVKFIPLERVHGRMGRALEISTRSLVEHGPGFAASVVRHELEHRILTRKGVPSGDQERRVRHTTGMWAALKAGSMAKTNPRAAEGFMRAARDQGVLREGDVEGHEFHGNQWTGGGGTPSVVDGWRSQLPKELIKFFPRSSEDATNGTFIGRLEANKELRSKKYENPYKDPRYADLIDVAGTKQALELATTVYAAELDEDLVTYRGVDPKLAAKLQHGSTFEDRGHVYVSTDKNLADKYAKRKGEVLEIHLPKGTKGAWGFQDQHEFILPRGAKFDISKVGGKTVLKLVR